MRMKHTLSQQLHHPLTNHTQNERGLRHHPRRRQHWPGTACMLLLATATTLLQHSLRASAFVAASTFTRSSNTASHLLRPLTASSGAINGDGFTSAENQPKKPQTGWTHSTPSEDSEFWKGPNQSSPTARESSSSSTTSSSSRTGWLHNTGNNNKSSPTTTMSSPADNDDGGAPKAGNMARRRLELAKLQQERNHRILTPPTFHPAGGDTVVAVTEHCLSVPLNYDTDLSLSHQPRLDVHFTIVEPVDTATRQFFETNLMDVATKPNHRAQRYVAHANLQNADDAMLYLQGGPGFGAPTPVVGLGVARGSGSWAAAALYTHGYRRLVLMDQRGTGRSTPITKQTLERKFPNLFLLDDNTSGGGGDSDGASSSPRLLEDCTGEAEYESVRAAVEQATDYFAHFRADNIVQDAEAIRDVLMVSTLEGDDTEADSDAGPKPRPWGCSLGQSYGGFCQMTYLSFVAHPPRTMLFTGGIAPMLSDLDRVYDSLWDRVRERNLRYYELYPGDVALVHTLVRKLEATPVQLPSGGWLTARRFLCLGIALGGSPTSFASFHTLLQTALVDGLSSIASGTNNLDDLEFTRAFLKQADMQLSFDDHPLYFWMHETIYANGPEHSPTTWAAHRVYEAKAQENQTAFDYKTTSAEARQEQPTIFFGEHVFPWMSHDFAELSGVGLRAVANALATKQDWGPLYDADHMKGVLESGRTKSAAAIYHEDMFVDFDACMKVTARDGPLGKCKMFVTNEYQHSGLRDNGAEIFSKLHRMAHGSVRTPS